MTYGSRAYDVYILDANAIRNIDYATLRLKIKQSQILITIEDVYREVAGLDKVDLLGVVKLEKNTYEKMQELITRYVSVQTLVDYVENKGAADVALVSFALTLNDGKFITETSCVVTGDTNLRTACEDTGVEWMSIQQFLDEL